MKNTVLLISLALLLAFMSLAVAEEAKKEKSIQGGLQARELQKMYGDNLVRTFEIPYYAYSLAGGFTADDNAYISNSNDIYRGSFLFSGTSGLLEKDFRKSKAEKEIEGHYNPQCDTYCLTTDKNLYRIRGDKTLLVKDLKTVREKCKKRLPKHITDIPENRRSYSSLITYEGAYFYCIYHCDDYFLLTNRYIERVEIQPKSYDVIQHNVVWKVNWSDLDPVLVGSYCGTLKLLHPSLPIFSFREWEFLPGSFSCTKSVVDLRNPEKQCRVSRIVVDSIGDAFYENHGGVVINDQNNLLAEYNPITSKIRLFTRENNSLVYKDDFSVPKLKTLMFYSDNLLLQTAKSELFLLNTKTKKRQFILDIGVKTIISFVNNHRVPLKGREWNGNILDLSTSLPVFEEIPLIDYSFCLHFSFDPSGKIVAFGDYIGGTFYDIENDKILGKVKVISQAEISAIGYVESLGGFVEVCRIGKKTYLQVYKIVDGKIQSELVVGNDPACCNFRSCYDGTLYLAILSHKKLEKFAEEHRNYRYSHVRDNIHFWSKYGNVEGVNSIACNNQGELLSLPQQDFSNPVIANGIRPTIIKGKESWEESMKITSIDGKTDLLFSRIWRTGDQVVLYNKLKEVYLFHLKTGLLTWYPHVDNPEFEVVYPVPNTKMVFMITSTYSLFLVKGVACKKDHPIAIKLKRIFSLE